MQTRLRQRGLWDLLGGQELAQFEERGIARDLQGLCTVDVAILGDGFAARRGSRRSR